MASLRPRGNNHGKSHNFPKNRDLEETAYETKNGKIEKRNNQYRKHFKHTHLNATLLCLCLVLIIREKYIKVPAPQENFRSDRIGENRRWANPMLLPSIPGRDGFENRRLSSVLAKKGEKVKRRKKDFLVRRRIESFSWLKNDNIIHGPNVDYNKVSISYPDLMTEVPEKGYPAVEPLKDIFNRWPQDALDEPPLPYQEKLLHFDFMDPIQRAAAAKFRDAELPFKMVNIPELDAATKKWTDEYLIGMFTSKDSFQGVPSISGQCQESMDNFFVFFKEKMWDVKKMGRPPTMDNDFSFADWLKHARYADEVGIAANETHYYFQVGVPEEERKSPFNQWTFISRDLPSFSSTKKNFFQFDPEGQDGIQCRFGERGVTVGNHFDSGRNMVGMILGAKRYILSPPNAIGKLGIIPFKHHPGFRQSFLNFGQMSYLDDPVAVEDMPLEVREWLARAQRAPSIDTIVREGEALYIPTGWFHYIISLQMSAQCNTRSGVDLHGGSSEFGSKHDLEKWLLRESHEVFMLDK